MRFDIATQASPELALRALTDFSDERLRIWARTLDPATYELREHGDSWAVARETRAAARFTPSGQTPTPVANDSPSP